MANRRVACIIRAMLGMVWSLAVASPAIAEDAAELDTSRGDAMIASYFEHETRPIADAAFTDIQSLEDWEARRGEYRRQLLEMLGLDPMPERTDLEPVVTGTVEHDAFTVEKLHFQSRPGLYVTANLYIPRDLDGPAPAILYLCGHASRAEDGISFGNKTAYQHHPAWFARHGFVAMVIDTVQLGEIEGLHHGTYREGMWWWNARGYTPAGAEAWNAIRALDYLETRQEVDAERLGVTGRSGGGAYSWWLAAVDERVAAAVPVAGITDLEDHVVEGVVEGHCDCMYIVNTHRWDYARVAALVAPRPLLISNTDKDPIFPLEGVLRIHSQVRDIYRLYDAEDKLGLHITEGPHRDTQDLRIHAFSWFNRFLKDERPLIEEPAVGFFEPAELRVFDELPDDEINTRIHETFMAEAERPAVPESLGVWEEVRDRWMAALRWGSFAAWPEEAPDLDVSDGFSAEREGVRLSAYDFTSQDRVRLRLYVARRAGTEAPGAVSLRVLDEQGWPEWLVMMRAEFEAELAEEMAVGPDAERFAELRSALEDEDAALAFIAPRGVGPTAWGQSERNQTQVRRRFMLLGQTLDGMRIWDARRAIEAVRSVEGLADAKLTLAGKRHAAGIVLYASLFEDGVDALRLERLPETHAEGPILLNVLKHLDAPQAVAMALERGDVELVVEGEDGDAWDYPRGVAEALGWERRLRIDSSGAEE